jgi:multiple sugar transport system substrate-binding protein
MKTARILALLLAVAGFAFAQTTVSYFSFTTDQSHMDELEALIEIFESQNPEIEIAVSTAPYDNYFTKLQTDYAAGNAADVFELNYENFVTFASRGLLEPLAEHLTGDDGVAEGTFYPAALNAFSHDGTQYGLPITFSTVVLYYNADLFDAAGLAYPDNDWTWDDLLAAATDLTDAQNRVWGVHQPVQFWEFYKVAAQAGGGLTLDPTIQIDTPENREALAYLVDKTRVHGVMPTTAEMSGLGDADMFAAGQLAMTITGIWMFDSFINNADFNWDIAVEPGQERRATHFFSNAAVVNDGAADVDAAWKWVKFLASDPAVAEARIASSWELPALSLEASDVLEPYLAQEQPGNREAVFESLRYAVNPPVVEKQPELQDIINQELEAALLGAKSVEAALASAQQRVEELLGE